MRRRRSQAKLKGRIAKRIEAAKSVKKPAAAPATTKKK
jgi:hypothetical protein